MMWISQHHDEYVAWLTDPAWYAPVGGERAVDIARRSSQVLDEIEHTHQSGHILLVSHKATIRIMLCTLLGIDVGRYRDRMDMPVAAVSVVELAKRGPLFHTISDRSHLKRSPAVSTLHLRTCHTYAPEALFAPQCRNRLLPHRVATVVGMVSSLTERGSRWPVFLLKPMGISIGRRVFVARSKTLP
jgi:hypothetical protein